MKTIGFIGLGVMGKSMARHLLKAGYPLLAYTRTKEKAEDLLQEGAVWKETVADLAREADVVMTMVGDPRDVEQVYFGEGGILENARPGTYVIDMTTSTPTLAQSIYEAAKQKGIHALDAPVSGGDIGAREGTLTIMVGGDEDVFLACKPILERLGTNIVRQGGAGAGQHTKMCNQIAIATNMIGVCEAMAYAKRAGLDPFKVLESIAKGAAGSWSLSNLAPRMLSGDFAPGFYVKHFIKDMKIALEEAERMNLPLPGLALAKQLYEELAQAGEENSGTQALYKRYVKA
ncbi:NAD-binding protein [Geobacillus thermoleovorans]|jgi:3-hydroxyisobutyrate dehydrogenase|uniref:3-hydroxyisobutyrate dehydrogenase n=6 Tax=Geobacillus TaxID=129337 RepID=Q5L168_GEOKA|nr:3-hydroxyisobutyrate dehydrogenase [Geobacillus thermoleovorans CCB_US3_UF5]AMV10272.1 oxidoreductase [Geobacillus thermoleovorans]EQB95981.1 oxidoreductase [Geobacillus sp. A8]ESU71530.1 oxidoreductase [Geobacillus sp. MAS1]KDE49638.1 oxidoreductase [Geobacillus sp. CAMR5420]MCG6795824.1 NAD(P)-dependent oxidoreductase [Geobacillus sp. YHL]OKO94621.1 2-hydroxy-3-oxopropionate reductase [Geobacillus proteiniphilus]QCK82353.1 NAD(P)-dependent oxidoreductase [Geobacillus kaustophilus NBRC 1